MVTRDLQRAVERHYTDLFERATDAISNIALVQGFTRVEAEVSGLRNMTGQLLAAQMPVLSWWAVTSVITRASTTLTMLSIFLVGIWLHVLGLATIGEIVMFMSLATMLIAKLEQAVGFANRILLDMPRLREFFGVLDTAPAVRDRDQILSLLADLATASGSLAGTAPPVAPGATAQASAPLREAHATYRAIWQGRQLILALRRDDEEIVLLALDRGPGFSWNPSLPESDRENGRGLFMIDALSRRVRVEAQQRKRDEGRRRSRDDSGHHH